MGQPVNETAHDLIIGSGGKDSWNFDFMSTGVCGKQTRGGACGQVIRGKELIPSEQWVGGSAHAIDGEEWRLRQLFFPCVRHSASHDPALCVSPSSAPSPTMSVSS